jgi:hypothetical protein
MPSPTSEQDASIPFAQNAIEEKRPIDGPRRNLPPQKETSLRQKDEKKSPFPIPKGVVGKKTNPHNKNIFLKKGVFMKRKMMGLALLVAGLLASVGIVSGVNSPILPGNAGTSEYSLSFGQDNHIQALVTSGETVDLKTDLGNTIVFGLFGVNDVSEVSYTSSTAVLGFSGGAYIRNNTPLSGLLRLEGAFASSSASTSLDISYGYTDGTDYNQTGEVSYSSFPIALPGKVNYFKIGAVSSASVTLSSFKVIYSCSDAPATSPLLFSKNTAGTTYTVSGYNSAYAPTDLVIPDTYLSLPVVGVKDHLSPFRSSLTSLTIGKNVTSIGIYAFQDMPYLKTVHFAANSALTSLGRYAFYRDVQLTSIDTLPSGITEIPEYCFSFANNLTGITAAGTISKINDYAFNGCTALTSAPMIPNATYIGIQAFKDTALSGAISLNPALTYFGYGAFDNVQGVTAFSMDNTSSTTYETLSSLLLSKDGKKLVAIPAHLSALTLPYEITEISTSAGNSSTRLTSISLSTSANDFIVGSWAFAHCSKLANFDLSKITSIDGYAFYGTALTSATLSKLTTIKQYAFANCLSLTNVTFSNALSSFENGSIFANDTALSSISISATNTSYEVLYSNFLVNSDGTQLYFGGVVSEENAGNSYQTIPDSITTIRPHAFEGSYQSLNLANTQTIVASAFLNYNGSTVVLGLALSTIGKQSFQDCPNLSLVSFSQGTSSLTKIQDITFANCPKLTSIVLPASVTSIDSYNFPVALTAVYYEGTQAQWAAISFGAISNGGLSASMTPSGGVLKLYSGTTPAANPSYYWSYSTEKTLPVLYS